jgi:peptide deformylase
MKTAKDSIISLPNNHLRNKSKNVDSINDEVKQIVNTMKLATIDWENSRDFEVGVALAAIQIDQPYRIIIIRQDFDNKKNHEFMVLINPEIIKLDGKIIDDYEGCLSVSDIYGKIPRFEKVKIKALDENGNKVKFSAKGFLARVLQHEIDHLEGKLFVDRIKNKKHAFYKLDHKGQLSELNWEKDVKESGLFR